MSAEVFKLHYSFDENMNKIETGQIRFKCLGCKCFHYIPIKGEKAWGFNGNFVKPTLSPSIKVFTEEYTDPEDGFKIPATCCHTFVTDGMIQYLGDCTHDLKGQTIPLPVLAENE